MRLITIVLFNLCVMTSAAMAEELNQQLEKEAVQIENLLIAPCCWRQPVAVHFSPAADEVRAEIRRMLAAGATRKEILDRYVAEYGERILSKPPAHGFNLLAYLLPLLFLVLGAGVAIAVVKKLRPSEAPDLGKYEERSPVDSKYAEKIEKELWG